MSLQKRSNALKKLNTLGKSAKVQSVKLRGILPEVLRLLNNNPTSKYIIETTGKSEVIVSRAIKKLIERGYVKRLDKGVFKVLSAHSEVLQTVKKYWRLHNLEIEILIRKEIHQFIKSTVMHNQQKFNVRSCANIGHYFDADVVGKITTNKLFLKFPKDWELRSESRETILKDLYEVIKEAVYKWQTRFKVPLWKDNRMNFNIRNIHLALVENGVAQELEEHDIKGIVSYDDKDQKPRIIIDWSKGFPELECVHPEHALDDMDYFDEWVDSVKDSEYHKILREYPEIRRISIQNSLILQYLFKPPKVDDYEKDSKLPSYFG